MPTTQLLAGLVLSSAIGWLAYRRNSLSHSGVAGAVITGTLIFGFGGWTWGVVLIAFFVSSTLLSHWRQADKAGLAEKFAKGERRDLGQTLANGGFGALLAVAVFLLVDLPGEVRLGNPTYAFLALAYFGAMATVNADTWATELGVLASRGTATDHQWTHGRGRYIGRDHRRGHAGSAGRRRVHRPLRVPVHPGSSGRDHRQPAADRPAADRHRSCGRAGRVAGGQPAGRDRAEHLLVRLMPKGNRAAGSHLRSDDQAAARLALVEQRPGQFRVIDSWRPAGCCPWFGDSSLAAYNFCLL